MLRSFVWIVRLRCYFESHALETDCSACFCVHAILGQSAPFLSLRHCVQTSLLLKQAAAPYDQKLQPQMSSRPGLPILPAKVVVNEWRTIFGGHKTKKKL